MEVNSIFRPARKTMRRAGSRVRSANWRTVGPSSVRRRKQRPNPGDELLESEGLGQVVIRSGIQAEDLVLDRRPNREKQNRRLDFFLAELSEDLQPVLSGEADVQDDQIVHPVQGHGQGLFSIRRRRPPRTLPLPGPAG